MRDEVVPAGHEHEVRIGEFFFSVTDAGGVIELANATFVRLSHYPHGELIGAPHNIIRHPDRPAGAFKLVWDQLRAVRPACAYVATSPRTAAPITSSRPSCPSATGCSRCGCDRWYRRSARPPSGCTRRSGPSSWPRGRTARAGTRPPSWGWACCCGGSKRWAWRMQTTWRWSRCPRSWRRTNASPAACRAGRAPSGRWPICSPRCMTCRRGPRGSWPSWTSTRG